MWTVTDKILCFAFIIIAIIYTAYCQNAKGLSDAWPNIKLRPSTAKWTHFMYIIADNNLDPYAAINMYQMTQNNVSNEDLNLVVYIDRCSIDGCNNLPQSKVPIMYIYDCDTMQNISGIFNGSKILQKQNNIWCQIYDFGHELDSKLPENIANFTGLMKQFELTSTYFVLIFWDHGGAWKGYGPDEHTGGSNADRTIFIEGTIQPNYLFNAVRNGLQMTHLGRLDILGFDACIMADFNVIHYITQYDITKYYIASEILEPGDGWDYQHGINAASLNPVEYAISIINAYVAQFNKPSDLSSGFTLTLFDMDSIGKFLNEFDALIRMMTLSISNYDYGIIMSLFRARSATIGLLKNSQSIIDLGLFLQNLVDEKNIYFNVCNDRLKMAGHNALKYLNESIIYFDADPLHKKMTGSTIFFSFNKNIIDEYEKYNDNDYFSKNYEEFIGSVYDVLLQINNVSESRFLTNLSCSVPITDDASFQVWSDIQVKETSDQKLYKISTAVSSKVRNATTYLQYPLEIPLNNDSYLLPLLIADLDTKVIDEDFDTTSLVTYWDGNITYFADTYNENNTMFATASITYIYDSISTDSLPIGYTTEYEVNISGTYDTFKGYIQFETIFDDDGQDTTTEMKLFIMAAGTIGEVPKSMEYILPIRAVAKVIVNGEIVEIINGELIWPFFIPKTDVYPFNVANITMIAEDIFQSKDESTISVNTNVTYQYISTAFPSTTLETSTTSKATTIVTTSLIDNITRSISSTYTTETTLSKVEATDKTDTGLDAVSGVVWLIIVIILAIAVVILLVLLIKKTRMRKGIARLPSSDNTKEQMIEMDEKGDGRKLETLINEESNQ